MKKQIILSVVIFSTIFCSMAGHGVRAQVSQSGHLAISALLDAMNVAAARADFDRYFSFFDGDAVFMGTDATERWSKPQFQQWAKPYFDKKQTWDFTSVSRNIYFNQDSSLAWFDELLKTEMKICRGSGVLVRRDGDWRLKQYVLSMTIPNKAISDVILLKSPEEDSLLNNIYRR